MLIAHNHKVHTVSCDCCNLNAHYTSGVKYHRMQKKRKKKKKVQCFEQTQRPRPDVYNNWSQTDRTRLLTTSKGSHSADRGYSPYAFKYRNNGPYESVQLSPLTDWVVGETWRTIQQRSSSSRYYRRPFWVVLAWVRISFDVVHPVCSLPTTASPTFQDSLEDGFEETVVAWGMPKPCKFPSLDSYQKGFQSIYKNTDLAPVSYTHLTLPTKLSV